MRSQMSQINGLGHVLMICLLAFTRGDEYSVQVLPTETMDDNGVCYKMVTVTGNRVVAEVPVQCDMVAYIIANDKQLVVGDKVYSDKAGTLIVLGPEGCEQRTYVNGVLESNMKLSDGDCEDVKLKMIKAYVIADPEVGDDNTESQIKAYDGLGNWAEDSVQPDSNRKSGKTSNEDRRDF